MRLASTTLAGPGTEAIIGDALRSVAGWVDACLVIWTGPATGAAAVSAACWEAIGENDCPPILWREWPWRDDFAAARNAALEFATELGAEWALTLDTDERMCLGEEDLDAALSSDVCVWLARDQAEGYAKERIIRLPAGAPWRGRTHEGCMDPRKRGTLERMTFTELPKSAEAMRVKSLRDEPLLRAEVEANPTEARWRYYLGVTMRNQGRFEDAVREFLACARLSQWDEEAAMSCFEAARLYETLGRYTECIEACAYGMRHHAGIAELPWLAGLACLRLGRMDQAAHWAKLAKVHGRRGDGVALGGRLLSKSARALGPGPDEILALCQGS